MFVVWSLSLWGFCPTIFVVGALWRVNILSYKCLFYGILSDKICRKDFSHYECFVRPSMSFGILLCEHFSYNVVFSFFFFFVMWTFGPIRFLVHFRLLTTAIHMNVQVNLFFTKIKYYLSFITWWWHWILWHCRWIQIKRYIIIISPNNIKHKSSVLCVCTHNI